MGGQDGPVEVVPVHAQGDRGGSKTLHHHAIEQVQARHRHGPVRERIEMADADTGNVAQPADPRRNGLVVGDDQVQPGRVEGVDIPLHFAEAQLKRRRHMVDSAALGDKGQPSPSGVGREHGIQPFGIQWRAAEQDVHIVAARLERRHHGSGPGDMSAAGGLDAVEYPHQPLAARRSSLGSAPCGVRLPSRSRRCSLVHLEVA